MRWLSLVQYASGRGVLRLAERGVRWKGRTSTSPKLQGLHRPARDRRKLTLDRSAGC